MNPGMPHDYLFSVYDNFVFDDNLSSSDNIFLIIHFISIVEEKPIVSAKLTVDSFLRSSSWPIINFKSIVKEKPSLVPT